MENSIASTMFNQFQVPDDCGYYSSLDESGYYSSLDDHWQQNAQIVPSPSNSSALSSNESSLNWMDENSLTLSMNCLPRKVKQESNDLLDMSLLDGVDLCSTSNMFQIHNNNNGRFNSQRKSNAVSGFSNFNANDIFPSDTSSWLLNSIKRETSEDMDFSILCNGLSTKSVNNMIVKTEDATSVYPQASGVFKDLDQVHNLALEACTREIDVACENLGISADPFNWNSQDVQSWLNWQREQCKLPSFPLERFNMDGMTLCTLTESEFKERAPRSGETLHAQLEIWKTAANLAPQSCGSFKADDSFIELNTILNQWAGQGLSDGISTTSLPQITVSNELDYRVDSMSPSAACSPSSSIGRINGYEKSRMNLAPDTRIVTSDYGSEGTQSDDEISEDGCEVSSPSSLVSSPRAQAPGRNSGSHIHLWQFLKELLENPQEHGSCIRWTDRSKGIFKIEDSVKVARLWGKRKNRPAMNYDKLSRSIRQYYKKGIMKKTERSQRLVYQFCHPYGV